MSTFCYSSEELGKIPATQWGGKATGLHLLQTNGCNVPAFVVMPPKKILEMVKQKSYDVAAVEVAKLLHAERYIIRSNALIEDSKESSYAGQFMSKGNVFETDLASELQEVILHAEKYLNGKLTLFSVIVQEYIDPNISGVLFTRSPEGGRQFVLEYHEGAGELLVSGTITPTTVEAYWQENRLIKLPDWESAKPILRALEDSGGHPQDIEWCIKNGVWYIVQTRPITTIISDRYKEITSLESLLPVDEEYRYVKNDITDIVGTPYPLSVSLLEYIYTEGGPVANAYRAQGIIYKNTQFFTLLGKSLYIDSVKEMASLLPSFTVDIQTGKQVFTLHPGLIRTIGNLIKLSIFNLKPLLIVQNFSKHVAKAQSISTINEWKVSFAEAYQDIFNANLLASTALSHITLLLKKESVDVLDVLSGSSGLDAEYMKLQSELPKPVGNGLDISDTSVFSVSPLKSHIENEIVTQWLSTLSIGKKKYLQKKINAAREGERIREMGRWLTVVYISKLRELSKQVAKECGLSKDEWLFTTLDELIENEIDSSIINERKKAFNKLPECNDAIVTSRFAEGGNKKGMGVSEGIEKGILVDISSIEKTSEKNIILLVETLSPDLTKYFNHVNGICSMRGGMLSHLAIMAREQKIPVIIEPGIDRSLIGKMVQIDGKTGEIGKV
jgi:phosphohistidine swiveling domain-containing protein